jgi:hypothetical protein
MLRSTLIGAALLFGAACYHGPSLRTFRPANSPAGIDADLRLRKTQVRGELLEVQDSALIVLTESQTIVMVPVDSIRRGIFGERGMLIGEGRDRPRALAQLRLLSRFPAGLTPDLRARLLAAYGQTEVKVAR